MQRSDILKKATHVVLKFGTGVLTEHIEKRSQAYFGAIAKECLALQKQGKKVIIVSSGAVGFGRAILKERNKLALPKASVSEKQALASLGQSLLIETYRTSFAKNKLAAAQVLLTRTDFENKLHLQNLKATLAQLLDWGAVPVINENDTIANEEIKVGDNDNLSADIALLFPKSLLILLTTIDGFYRGEFGAGLLTLQRSTIIGTDLAMDCARWTKPLHASAWGVELWVAPPPSQGYLLPASALLAESCELPDPSDAAWADLLIACATAAGYDRPEVLYDGADGEQLLAKAAARGEWLGRTDLRPPGRPGDTTYLCVTDAAGMAVSLIQSNAAGFGSQLAEPSTQINLHNRGLGFNLIAGHPAELTAGKRPPHTLVPALATDDQGLRAVFGTMGGDAQPQILLQLAARLFHHGQWPADAVDAGRWALRAPTGFDTWTSGETEVAVEAQAPPSWLPGLAERGHRVVRLPAFDSAVGHAHVIARRPDGSWAAAADPRTVIGSVAGPVVKTT